MAVRGAQQRIISVIHGWQEVEIRPHRYGGLEFRLGKRELGHVHGDALVDIPFYKRGCQEKHFPCDWKRSGHPAPRCYEAL